MLKMRLQIHVNPVYAMIISQTQIETFPLHTTKTLSLPIRVIVWVKRKKIVSEDQRQNNVYTWDLSLSGWVQYLWSGLPKGLIKGGAIIGPSKARWDYHAFLCLKVKAQCAENPVSIERRENTRSHVVVTQKFLRYYSNELHLRSIEITKHHRGSVSVRKN